MKSGSTKSETKVARLRCERGLTQAALAEKTGVNIRAIQRYESGERKIEGASLTVALRIADALGVTRQAVHKKFAKRVDPTLLHPTRQEKP